jgi:hypothetical protein
VLTTLSASSSAGDAARTGLGALGDSTDAPGEAGPKRGMVRRRGIQSFSHDLG